MPIPPGTARSLDASGNLTPEGCPAPDGRTPGPVGGQDGRERAPGAASPCRLFVYLARDAPVAAVLRRGPSAWARLSLWRTDSDTFEHGQWTRTRVYERRADLSPDGSLFVCFARANGGRARPGRDSWVALSRPPWFAALALWFVGGTWCAGGYFPGPRTLWLGFGPDPPDEGRLPPWLAAAAPADGYTDGTPNWTERTVWLNRLRRDGWERVGGAVPETWRRAEPGGGRALAMTLRSEADFAAYGGPHVVEYALAPGAGGAAIPLGRADWADWDHRGRLVLARGGRLLHWEPPGTVREIVDLNGQAPVSAPAPGWARDWPAPAGRPR